MRANSLGGAMVLAYEFKLYRVQNGMSPDDLADELGLDVATIRQIESCSIKASVLTQERFRALLLNEDIGHSGPDEFIKLVETSPADMFLFDPEDNLAATSRLHKEARKYEWKDIRYRSRFDLEPESTLRLCEEAGAFGKTYTRLASFDQVYRRGPDKVNNSGEDIWGRLVSRPLILGNDQVWRIVSGIILPYTPGLKPVVKKID
ncbi:MAG: helix-turn-helix transcriptional regulator [Pseudomonadota bacterium]